MSGQATCSYFFFTGMMRPNIAQVRLQVIKHFLMLFVHRIALSMVPQLS